MSAATTQAPATSGEPVLSAAAGQRLGELKTLLTTDLGRFDVVVTGDEAQRALNSLATLSPSDFRQVMAELQAEGLVDVMLEKLPWAQQCRFLEVAHEKGYLEREAGEAPRGPFEPPRAPDLYRMQATLPRCVNDLIHEHSKASVEAYKRDYDAYVERYAEGVSRCGSLAEVRALGRPLQPSTTWELRDFRDPRSDFYERDWAVGRCVASPLAAYAAVADRMAELSGERKDGSFWFEAKLEGQVAGFAFDADVVTGDPSRPALKGKVGMATPNLTGDTYATGKIKSDGSREVAVGSKFGNVGVSGSATFDEDMKLKKGSLNVGPVGVTTDGGTHQLNLSPLKVGAGQVKAEAGSYAAGNRAKGELKGGLQAKARLGPLMDGKAQIGFGIKGISEKTAARALSGESVFDTRLPELERGVAWAALPPARREALEKLGWSEAEWSSQLESGRSES
ncbi:MAG: hypothetical protein AB1938_03560 [Myxococcota bacterium]